MSTKPSNARSTNLPAASAPEPPKTGPLVIASYLEMLPGSPGVYRMMDAKGEVIYVGKARSLKVRVSSYARLAGHANRTARMISETASMEFVTVRTEAEALLLEANLIKRFRPRFNVTMRDDKSFPYILIARGHEAPQIVKHRGARAREGDYFGPFASAGAVNRTINMLQRAFLLRSCSDAVYASRTRPCLLFQIKRCSAPCTGEIALPEYAGLVAEAEQFLHGESQNMRHMYQQLMAEAAERLDYEQAARYRNRLWALAHVTADQAINPEGIEEADIFAAHQDGGQTCIEVFFFRTGQNWGNRAYFPKADRSLPVEEVMASFVAQFYDDKPVPRLILMSHDIAERALLAEALVTKAGRRVEIRVPQRGSKVGLVEHALANAREALGRRLAESASQRALLDALCERFGLAQAPRRIEVFDNSHIAGTNAVGAMIVAGPDGFVKSQYRKYNIRSADLTPGDDYAMMREVLGRRFKRLVAEEVEAAPQTPSRESWEVDKPAPLIQPQAPSPAPLRVAASPRRGEAPPPASSNSPTSHRGEAPTPASGDSPSPRRGEGRGEGASLTPSVVGSSTPDPSSHGGGELDFTPALAGEESDNTPPGRPDLVLIDGGAGQLAVAREVLADLGLHEVCVIGVAKGPDRDAGREHFHMPGEGKPLMLEPRDPVLYFVQRLRDEAHRFAIGAHRAKRSKALGANPLDEVAGIGPRRRRALLLHFGSAKAVSRAGVEDLKTVGGISAEMAQRIYDFFHDRRGPE